MLSNNFGNTKLMYTMILIARAGSLYIHRLLKKKKKKTCDRSSLLQYWTDLNSSTIKTKIITRLTTLIKKTQHYCYYLHYYYIESEHLGYTRVFQEVETSW